MVQYMLELYKFHRTKEHISSSVSFSLEAEVLYLLKVQHCCPLL